jgi:glycosyltransferase involved in cell wall biosynthesis
VLIEAMACGIPVIGSNAGEIPNVIANAGLIFEQKNEVGLLAQLQALMQDDQLRMRLGEKGRKRVECYYSHEAIAKNTHDYWRLLLHS